MKKTLIILAAVLVCFFCYRFFDQQFRLTNIETTWPDEGRILSAQEKMQLEPILSQTYDYLDRGKQSYVFSSWDGKYVLKFFDTRCLHSGALPLLFPIDAKRCAKKLQDLVSGYRLAWNRDRLHTGVIYVQLSSNPLNPFKVAVYDRFGFKHEMDLAKVPFILQERAIPTRELITALLNKGDVVEARKRVQLLKEMYIEEYRLGIIDGDHNVMYNTGFVGDRPVRLDAGRLHYDEAIVNPTLYQQDLDKVFKGRVNEWLNRHFPQYNLL
ncbi:MAG: hypothetical protein WCF65_06785 [Parachlamydiaceae bacterium]